MLSEKEINLVLGKDLIETKKKEELSFRDWLTVKGIAAVDGQAYHQLRQPYATGRTTPRFLSGKTPRGSG